jgi:hypothetical protein
MMQTKDNLAVAMMLSTKTLRNKGAMMKETTKKLPQSRKPWRLGDTISDPTGLVTTTTGLPIKWTLQKVRKVTGIPSSCSRKSSKVPSIREAVDHMNNSGSNMKVFECITGFMMTQMTAKAGIKKHRQVAIDVLYHKFLQLHDL